MIYFLEILKALFLGIVEGITEWLPISSTGHMILVDEFIDLDVSPSFKEMFFVVIQLGAILAVPIVFYKKLFPFGKSVDLEDKRRIYSLWLKVLVGVIPATVVGFLFDELLERYLYNYVVVSVALIVYGVAFLLIERPKSPHQYRIDSVYDLTCKDAFLIGAYQVLSLVPGTSRSGSTILGGMLTCVSRTASAEFSFFMAIPIMLGASGLKVMKFILGGYTATPTELLLLLVGTVAAFLISLIAIEFLMSFVKRHSFLAFGIYRIVLGAFVLGYFLLKI